MRTGEVRRCPLCGAVMRPVPGTDRTWRDKVWFRLGCAACGHEEMEWTSRREWPLMGVRPW